jgi:hypothetical protein
MRRSVGQIYLERGGASTGEEEKEEEEDK